MTDLEQEKRAAFEEQLRFEVPKLTNIRAVTAKEYFDYGWEAALVAIHAVAKVHQTKPIITRTTPTATVLQLAAVMGLHGTPEQQDQSRQFITSVIHKV